MFLTARTTAMVCWLFIGSFCFSAVFAYLGGHEPIEKFVLAMNLSPTGFMILAQFIIFVLGWPLEWTEIIVIFMPIFLPLLKTFDVDPLFFGLLVALNIQTSFLSPPVAMAPFYLKGVAPEWVNINDIFRGVMPYVLIVIVCMIMLYTFPQIGLWLPSVPVPVTTAGGRVNSTARWCGRHKCSSCLPVRPWRCSDRPLGLAARCHAAERLTDRQIPSTSHTWRSPSRPPSRSGSQCIASPAPSTISGNSQSGSKKIEAASAGGLAF